MRCLMLSNPNSTSINEQVLRQAITPLRKVAELHSVHTLHRGHAAELTRGVTRADFDVVVAVGGDGTVNEVLKGLLGNDPTARPSAESLPRLAIIPTGSANVFARALGFPNAPGAAAEMLAEMLTPLTSRRLPVGLVNNHWFCVNAGFGLDAEVINQMDRIRSYGIPATPWHYSLVAFSAWRRLHRTPPHIHFEALTRDGDTVAGDVPIVIVSNTNPWTYAGPVPVVTNPEHRLEDGCSLYALEDISGVGGFIAVMNAMGIPVNSLTRDRVDFRETRVDDATKVTLTSKLPLKWQVDGEYAGKATELKIQTVPNAIDVICQL
ncbi:diacylglycerol kinase family protein [Corynebacterium sp. H128]|uniref:diacylglycerol/lipid kinase family protein n=1 Tax=unclassified Corynebacterium TaxID=2624378 RepID=UPI0030B50D3F